MIYNEEQRDLFTVGDEYYFAHCISADFALGAGIAAKFDRRFRCRDMLRAFYNFSGYDEPGYVLPTGRVFNLVTKQKYWQKPTYKTMRLALEDLKEALRIRKITKIAMPRIGCGLDRLEWETVKRMIQYIFADTDVEILICFQ